MSFFDTLSYLEERELIDAVLDAIEAEYGQLIARVVQIDKYPNFFKITVVFTDYMLLEANCFMNGTADDPIMEIDGQYY